MDFSTVLNLQQLQQELDLGHTIKVKAHFYDWFYLIWKGDEGKVWVRYGKEQVEIFDTLEQVILYYFFRVLEVIEKKPQGALIPVAWGVDENGLSKDIEM